MYETSPVKDAVNYATPTDGGYTTEEVLLKEPPLKFKEDRMCCPPVWTSLDDSHLADHTPQRKPLSYRQKVHIRGSSNLTFIINIVLGSPYLTFGILFDPP